jgi:multidrug efflux pump subunit AcrB
VTQILNFGLPAPVDIQLEGADIEGNRQVANQILNELRQVPGLTDLRIQQPFDYPRFHVDVDRTKAAQGGFTPRDVANSLLVSLSGTSQTNPTYFPRDALEAAIEAGFTRFRPVLMTALAMIIGMIPMALGLGDGGEQNAPLGRAVIGGLLCATVATLVFVPAVFSVFHGRRAPADSSHEPESDHQPMYV